MLQIPKKPAYFRQRFILKLLNSCGNKLTKMDFQKLLFLSQQDKQFSYYNFVPYHYGCYSFQAQEDLGILERLGWIEQSDKQITLKFNPPNYLSAESNNTIDKFAKTTKLRGRDLIKHVYEKYPYYTINSKIADQILETNTQQSLTHTSTPNDEHTALFTIGYEGISFEQYINMLIKNNVQILCDVRKNPLSRKFGFSKNTLSRVLPKLGIKYIHIPSLGIQSENRKNLNTKEDYANLFNEYRHSLETKHRELSLIIDMLLQNKRVALTCFEHDHTSCHRHCVSEGIEHLKPKIKVIHI